MGTLWERLCLSAVQEMCGSCPLCSAQHLSLSFSLSLSSLSSLSLSLSLSHAASQARPLCARKGVICQPAVAEVKPWRLKGCDPRSAGSSVAPPHSGHNRVGEGRCWGGEEWMLLIGVLEERHKENASSAYFR